MFRFGLSEWRQAIYAKAEQYDPNIAAIISMLELRPSPNAASTMKRPGIPDDKPMTKKG